MAAQAPVHRCIGIYDLGQQHQARGPRGPKPRQQALSAPGTGDKPQIGFGQAQTGGIAQNHQIRHQGQFQTATKGKAVDGRNHGLWKAPDGGPMCFARINRALGCGFCLDLGNVGPGCKMAPRARQHHGPARGLVGKRRQTRGQCGKHAGVQGISNLGPRKGQQNPAVAVVFDQAFHDHIMKHRQKTSSRKFSNLKLFWRNGRLICNKGVC